MSLDLQNVQMEIDFYASGTDEIYQNIKTILTTPAGTVPFDRRFGVDIEIVDKPIEQAKNAITVEYITKIKRYEPRVKVKQVSFQHNALNGIIIPKVVIGLNV